LKKTNEQEINIQTLGGNLKIEFEIENKVYKNIILTGPAAFVFKGQIELP